MKKIIIFIAVFALLGIKANAQNGNFFSEINLFSVNNLNMKYEVFSIPTNEKRMLKNKNATNFSFALGLGYYFSISNKIKGISKIGTPINFKFNDFIYAQNIITPGYLWFGDLYSISFIPATVGLNYKINEKFKTEVDFTYGFKLAEKKSYKIIDAWENESPLFFKYSIKGIYSHENQEVFVCLDLLNFAIPSDDFSSNRRQIYSNAINFGYRYNFLGRLTLDRQRFTPNRKEKNSMKVF